MQILRDVGTVKHDDRHNRYIVSINSPKNLKYFKKYAKKLNIHYTEQNPNYTRDVGTVKHDDRHNRYIVSINSPKNLKYFKKYAKKLNIHYTEQNPNYTRSSSYRSVFFKCNKGVGDERYFCAYCGCLLHKDDVTVDHVFPVAAARDKKIYQRLLKWFGITNINSNKNLAPACSYCNRKKSASDHVFPVAAARDKKIYQRLLKWFGITNINSNKNLAPACSYCNRKKSASMGLWLWKGYLGRNSFFWLVFHSFSFILFSFLLSFLFCLL